MKLGLPASLIGAAFVFLASRQPTVIAGRNGLKAVRRGCRRA
jgi:hypothetical protein